MSLYLEQIRQLVALQRVDDAIHSVEMELEQAPKELEDLKNRFAATNTQRERVLEKLAHLKEQEKRITGELDDDSSRIKKSKNKMMQVSNSREYQAMAREMDNMEKVNRSREEERAALLEESCIRTTRCRKSTLYGPTSRPSWKPSRSASKRGRTKPASVWMSWLRCVPKLAPLCRVPSLTAMSSSAAVCPIP